MRKHEMIAKQITPVFLFVILFTAITAPALAQSGFTLRVYPPELDLFPKITLYLDAYDPQGKFIPTLNLDSLRVFEDGYERILNEIQQQEPGLHTIIALNLGATLSDRPNTSVPTRYEETVFALASWLNGLESGVQNQYSLTSNEGILAENLQDKETFTYRLQNYKPNLFNFEPDFTSLSLALDIAAKPNLVAHSKQAILYITPLPLDKAMDQLPALQARAVELGLPVHVWLVAPEPAATSPAAEALNRLAVATGGSYLFYAEDSPMPDPEEYVGRLRSLYRLRFTSEINQSGAHTVRLEGKYGNQIVRTEEVTFSIDLNLPTIYLKDLPAEISRKYISTADGRMLDPTFITVQSQVIFPDGYERQLRATRFYVDGEVVAENTAEPFNFYGWPLEAYRFSGEHLLSVEVEDILGFRSISPPVSVMVVVESPYPTWLTALLEFLVGGGWIALAVAGMAGSVVLVQRLRRQKAENALAGLEARAMDPLEQTVPGLSTVIEEGEMPPSQRKSRAASEMPPRLVWAGSGSSPPGGAQIQVEQGQVIVGSDPEQCDRVIGDESISPRHARLVRMETGALTIADLGSEAGTWVNYAPVSGAGTVLNNGDLVHIGKVTYRYRIGTLK